MAIHRLVARMPDPVDEARPWRPFVVAALGFTLTAGALTGALDLWTLRVLQAPVPIDHHRAHGLAQLFGFLGLMTLGVSLHLAPRFFGAAPVGPRTARWLAWGSIGGVVALVVGRLGALVPGSAAIGLAGAGLVLASWSTWARLVWRLRRALWVQPEPLHRFVLAGVTWWAVAAAALLAWEVGQVFGGPLAGAPLELVWAAGLFGGTGSWLWGVFFRAGICTLKIARPSLEAQGRLFAAWQLAVAAGALAAAVPEPWVRALGGLALASACALLWFTLRPFSGQGVGGFAALQPRAVQAGLVLVATFGALSVWAAAGALGWLATPPLLVDTVRHAFTLGVTLLLLGFAGRMVPGFSGASLRWPRAYDAGVVAIALGAALRLAQLFVPSRLAQALAGASGGVAWLGLLLVAAALLRSLKPAPLPAGPPRKMTFLVKPGASSPG